MDHIKDICVYVNDYMNILSNLIMITYVGIINELKC